MQLSVFVMALVLALPGVARAQVIDAAAVDAAVPSGFRGAVVVHVGREPVYARGFGGEGPAGVAIDPGASLFDVGSIAKSYTAATLVELERAGVCAPGVTLGGVFEDAPEAVRGVALRDLASHTSGLTWAPSRGFGDLSDRDETVADLLGRARPRGDASFEYRNEHYFLLAAAIEVLADASFEDAVRAHVLGPASLDRTGFVGDGAVGGARPTRRIGRDGRSSDLFAYPWNWMQRGATGVVATPEDVAAWFDAIAERATVEGAAWGTMVEGERHGLGLELRSGDDGLTGFAHSGATGGYTSFASHHVGTGTTIVVLSGAAGNAAAVGGAIERAVGLVEARPSEGGLYLVRHPDDDGDGEVSIEEGLAWRVMPAYRAGGLVDERPTVVLGHAPTGVWLVILRMDHAEAESLLTSLMEAIRKVAQDPGARDAPWDAGMTATIRVHEERLNEHRALILASGARFEVSTEGVWVVSRLIETDASEAVASVRMGGADVFGLVRGLRGVTGQ